MAKDPRFDPRLVRKKTDESKKEDRTDDKILGKEIANDTILTNHLVNGAISTDKIANSAVTPIKTSFLTNGQTISPTISIVGSPNGGTYAGYLILAKAYVSGFQDTSEVTGTFYLSRGTVGTGNRGDTYTVISKSGYNSEGLLVQVAVAGTRYFSRTVKVTYQGTVYHAIETSVSGGDPSNGVTFQGIVRNAAPIYVDATSVSSISAFGNFTILENGVLQKPQTPMFSGYFTSYGSSFDYNPFLNTWFNSAFTVNAGASRLTVQYAGKYYVYCQQLVNTTGTTAYLMIRKNAITTIAYAYSNNDDTYDMNVGAFIDCAANDYIDFFYLGRTTYSWSQPHSSVVCFLVG